MNKTQKKLVDKLANKFAAGPEGSHDRSWTYEMLLKGFVAGATDVVLIKAIRLEERAKVLDDCVKSMQRNGIGGWGIYEEDKEEAQAELEQLLAEHEA